MADEPRPKPGVDQPKQYRIRLKGHLGAPWREWFEGLSITLEEDGDTLLYGPVVDQSALHGILKRIRDLGMPLLSVDSEDEDQRAGAETGRMEGDP